MPLTPTERTRAEIADFVVSRLREAGVDRGANSRFAQMKRLYDEASLIAIDNSLFNEAIEAERDFQTLAFVFDAIGELGTTQEFISLLKRAMKDSLLPEDDPSQSWGRDAQFHLYIAAVCSKAAVNPTLEEPDIRCTVGDCRFAVAAKRLKNMDRFEDRIKSAVEQIQRSRLPGIIAVDVSLAINPENHRPVVGNNEDLFMEQRKAMMRQFVDDRIGSRWVSGLREWTRGTLARGLILYESFVSDGRQGPPKFLALNYGVCTAQHNRRRAMEFHKFKNQFDQGLYNLQNEPHPIPAR